MSIAIVVVIAMTTFTALGGQGGHYVCVSNNTGYPLTFTFKQAISNSQCTSAKLNGVYSSITDGKTFTLSGNNNSTVCAYCLQDILATSGAVFKVSYQDPKSNETIVIGTAEPSFIVTGLKTFANNYATLIAGSGNTVQGCIYFKMRGYSITYYKHSWCPNTLSGFSY